MMNIFKLSFAIAVLLLASCSKDFVEFTSDTIVSEEATKSIQHEDIIGNTYSNADYSIEITSETSLIWTDLNRVYCDWEGGGPSETITADYELKGDVLVFSGESFVRTYQGSETIWGENAGGNTIYYDALESVSFSGNFMNTDKLVGSDVTIVTTTYYSYVGTLPSTSTPKISNEELTNCSFLIK